MPRIAAISDDVHSTFAEAAALAADYGLSGLAVRNVGGRNVLGIADDEVRDIRAAAQRRDLAISAVTSQLGRDLLVHSDDSDLADRVRRLTDIANALDCSLIRVFATWIGGMDPVGAWSQRPPRPVPPIVVDRLQRLAALAERHGTTLMLELEGASYVGTLDEAREVLARVDSPALAICWDVCNGWWSGEHPIAALPLAAELPIVDVQTKDVRVDPADSGRAGLVQVDLSTGDLPYAHVIDTLVAGGYDGWFTVERVFHPRRPEASPVLSSAIRADIEALHRLLRATAHEKKDLA